MNMTGYQSEPGAAAWKPDNVLCLPSKYGKDWFKGKSRVLESSEVRGVSDGIDKLNRNTVYCPEDHCVIYSESKQCYCLLFRKTLDSSSAMALLGIQPTQSIVRRSATQGTEQMHVAYQSPFEKATMDFHVGQTVALKGSDGEWIGRVFQATIMHIDKDADTIEVKYSDYGSTVWPRQVFESLLELEPVAEILPSDKMQWMWSDASVIGHDAARLNPWRWSDVQEPMEAIHGLAQVKQTERPVEIKVIRRGTVVKEMCFTSTAEAVKALKSQVDVDFTSGGEVDCEDDVEAIQANILIIDASLMRIFDSWYNYQRVYVKLQRVQPDGTEAFVGKTEVVVDKDKAPKWNEEFKYKRLNRNSNLIRISVYAQKAGVRSKIKGDTLCGSADINLSVLWKEVQEFKTQGGNGPFSKSLTLWKNLEETGQLNITITIEACQIQRRPTRQGTAASIADSDHTQVPDGQASGIANTRLTTMQGATATLPVFTTDHRRLLNRPEEMKEIARGIFNKIAKKCPEYGDNVKGMKFADMDKCANLLGGEVKVHQSVFGDREALECLFWRYNFSEYPILAEKDAVLLMMSMIRRYRDAINPDAEVELGIPIKDVSERYALGKELGRGGQAIVHIATQKDTGREVVLKMYACGNPDMPKEEISQEFQMLISLKHPKIARYYEIFEDGQSFYIVSEPYFGDNLTGLPSRANGKGVQVTEGWLSGIVLQMAQGLSYLHSHQIMHCDLKEANVMVANEQDLSAPQVVLIDFGLANHLSSTRRGGGSPGYMPPEVWTKDLWTPRGDVFSLGVVAYSLTFGNTPFIQGCKTIEDVRDRTLTLDVRMQFGSVSMREIVNRMLTKNYQQRPPIQSVVNCAWFKEQTESQTQAIDVSALEQMAQKSKQNRLRRALLADVASRENLAQLTELNQLFLDLDKDNDGVLTVSEAKSALQQHGWNDETIDQLMKCLAGSKDEVPYEEFMINMVGSMANEETALLERIFREADKGGKGVLNVDDIKELLERPVVAKVVGKRDAARLLRDMDKNKDGVVSMDEFKWVMHGMPAQTDTEHDSAPQSFLMNSILLTNTVMKKRGPAFQKDQQIEYYSTSYQQWIPGTIVDFRACDGAVQVTNKPGWWLTGEELKKVRPES